MKIVTLTAQNVDKYIGCDSKGVRHALLLRYPANYAWTQTMDLPAVAFRAKCGAHQWDTLDLIEGSPNCVRCVCAVR